MRKIVPIIVLIASTALLIIAIRQYSGYHQFSRYKILKSEAKSIESAFPALESALLKAIVHYKNPDFYKELGRLYLDRAIAENKYGDADKRDAYLEKAMTELAESIRRNPADSWAYFDLGKIYMLYNYPLMTYAEKARRIFQEALQINPANELLNRDVVYFHLIQWDQLNEAEKQFVWDRLDRNMKMDDGFLGRLRNQWIENAKTEEGLKAILMSNPSLWERIKGSFK